MNPSQMTDWSHARSHYYITSTVLHHCTECFSMNNTERLGREGCGHGYIMLEKSDRDHGEIEFRETFHTVKKKITSGTNAWILIELYWINESDILSYIYSSCVVTLHDLQAQDTVSESCYRQSTMRNGSSSGVAGPRLSEGRQGYRLVFSHEGAGCFAIERK